MPRAPNRPNIEFFGNEALGNVVFRSPDPETLALKATALLEDGWGVGKVYRAISWMHVGGKMYIDEYYEFHANKLAEGASYYGR